MKLCAVWMGKVQCGAIATHETKTSKTPVCQWHAMHWGKLYEVDD